MSEYINNREYRQAVLKELILELHGGKTVDEVKPRFEELIQGISPSEISEMEQGLIMNGMPVEEIQQLCDVHAAVFKGTIEEIHRPVKQEEKPGHPVHTFRQENRELEHLISKKIKPDLDAFRYDGTQEHVGEIAGDFEMLWQIDKHYLRKENLLFPYMERYGITAPPKVMWGVDDEIREQIKETRKLLQNYNGERDNLLDKAEKAIERVGEMIFKEENILFPMVLETLTEDEWLKIASESDDIGYCLFTPKAKWKPARVNLEGKAADAGSPAVNSEEVSGGATGAAGQLFGGSIRFETGILTPEEIGAMFNTMPVDITFVDKEGTVKYFSQGKERIFPRTKAIIGRKVQNCHPPASVHIVENIVEDLKAGRKDHEDFWIRMGGQFVYIRYFAVRNEKNEFLGVLEVTQNIKPIQELSGEKRLASDTPSD